MASVQTKANFSAQIQETRERIKTSFKRCHDSLIEREKILLTFVDEIETEFNHKIIEIQ